MIEYIFWGVLIALIIDGSKLLIESYSEISNNKGKRKPSLTTAVLSAYNEPHILETVETLKSEVNNFIIVEDQSTDNDETWNKLCTLKDDDNFLIIRNEENKGKVPSLHSVLEYVDTPYVFLCDADIYLDPDFEMPTSLIQEEYTDAVSFCVLPKEMKNSGWWKSLLYKLQNLEYLKSMRIGRNFATKSKSVECISGAGGLFKKEDVVEVAKNHTEYWQGEDLERTLLLLLSNKEVVYSENIIYTDAPDSLQGLSKQRILGWWGGLYRNLYLMLKILFKKESPLRLKAELIYNFVSLLVDPIKIFLFWVLVLTLDTLALSLLYFVYLFFEVLIALHLKIRYNVNISIFAVVLYPVYGILQLHYRILSSVYILFK